MPVSALVEPLAAASEDDDAPSSDPAAAPRILPGPRFEFLRYDDDFTYLLGPQGSYEPDPFDPIKSIRLGKDLTLSFGGEIRLRYESKRNEFLLPGDQPFDDFLLERYSLMLSLQYRKLARVFVEGIHADVHGREGQVFFIHRNRTDLHQAFLDVRLLGEDVPLTLRIGRQELLYGTQRMISPWGWGRIRQRFDGVKLFWSGDDWEIDAWYANLVAVDTVEVDERDDDVELYGVYATYKGIEGSELDFYLLGHRVTADLVNPNGAAGDRVSYTLGTRFGGRRSGFDWDLEANVQLGRWAGDDSRAWSVGGSLGYMLKENVLQPRAGMAFEIASGDRDPFDDTVQTFDQLYRQPKDFLGYYVAFGRQNVRAFNVNAGAWIVPKKVRLNAFHYWFWMDQTRDFVYTPGGSPFPQLRDVTGTSGRDLGTEFDLTIGWLIDPHQSVLFGYSRIWSGGFLSAQGVETDPALFYVQYQLRF